MSKSTWKIIFGGVGGQGLVLDGYLLGNASGVLEGRNVAMVAKYGGETRGTLTKSDLVVSDEEIDYPAADSPDVLVALAQVAYDAYVDSVQQDGIVIYDSGLVKVNENSLVQHGYPITEIALANGGKQTANLVAMGILIALTNIAKIESVEQALKNRFGEESAITAGNIRSFRAGVQCVNK